MFLTLFVSVPMILLFYIANVTSGAELRSFGLEQAGLGKARPASGRVACSRRESGKGEQLEFTQCRSFRCAAAIRASNLRSAVGHQSKGTPLSTSPRTYTDTGNANVADELRVHQNLSSNLPGTFSLAQKFFIFRQLILISKKNKFICQFYRLESDRLGSTEKLGV